jgi:hypothetical protein
MPKSSSIFANAAARLIPECDFATSTISSNIVSGTPFNSRVTVTATYALWLGEVHASVWKFRAPSCSYKKKVCDDLICCRLLTYLKYFSYPLSTPHKDLFHIAWDGSGWRDIVPRATGLHEALEASILDNAKWSHVFSNPTDDLRPFIGLASFIRRIQEVGGLTWSRSLCVVYVSTSLLPVP